MRNVTRRSLPICGEISVSFGVGCRRGGCAAIRGRCPAANMSKPVPRSNTRFGPVVKLFICLCPRFLDAIQMIDSTQDKSARCNGGRRPEHLVELALAKHLELRPGLEHKRLPGLIQAKDLAVIGPGR